jgi:hypothetical protein
MFHKFWFAIIWYSLIPGTSWFSCLFLWGPTDHWTMCCLVFSCLSIFCCFFCYWVLVLLCCGQTMFRGLFQLSYVCWDLLYDLKYVWFCRKFHGLLKIMYIVLFQDGILIDICQVHLICSVIQF